jgi:hypothetical protein
VDANRLQHRPSTLRTVPTAPVPAPGAAPGPGHHRGGRIVVTADGPVTTVALSDGDDPDLLALANEVVAAARAAGVEVVLEATPGAR